MPLAKRLRIAYLSRRIGIAGAEVKSRVLAGGGDGVAKR